VCRQYQGYRRHARESKDRAQRLFQTTADTIFSTLVPSCARLTVVVFETYGDAEGTYAFLMLKQIGLNGQMAVVGTPVEPRMVKHYEPCSDVLKDANFAFA
jgi:hypothetical protein